jgi:hypothetical protein
VQVRAPRDHTAPTATTASQSSSPVTTSQPSLGETLEPVAKPLDVRAAAAEELAAKAHVKAGPAHDIGHESVAGDEAAAWERSRKRTDVETIARAASSLGKVAFEHRLETPLAVAHDGAAGVGKPEAG